MDYEKQLDKNSSQATTFHWFRNQVAIYLPVPVLCISGNPTATLLLFHFNNHMARHLAAAILLKGLNHVKG